MKVNTKYTVLSLLLILCGISLFSEISDRFGARFTFLPIQTTSVRNDNESSKTKIPEITHRKTRTKKASSNTQDPNNEHSNLEDEPLFLAEYTNNNDHNYTSSIISNIESHSVDDKTILAEAETLDENKQTNIDNLGDNDKLSLSNTENLNNNNPPVSSILESHSEINEEKDVNKNTTKNNKNDLNGLLTEIHTNTLVPTDKSNNQEHGNEIKEPSSKSENNFDLRTRLKNKQNKEPQYSRYLASNKTQTTSNYVSNVASPSPTETTALPPDTGIIYPVRKTQITQYEDLIKKNPIDLKDPSNVSTEIEYDIKNNTYQFKTKIDNDEWITPFTLNPDQYSQYWLKKSMSNYFKTKNSEAFAKGEDKTGFSLRDVKVNLNALDRIFGPGGVQIQPNGYLETIMGVKHTKTDNPIIPERNRSRFMFDFDTKIQVSAKASVGNKVNFDLNYDTESMFDFDTKRIKLAYEGEEDEILKYLEAGNVSMTTTNSLIQGGSSLFGIKSDLQFGKLKVSSVISQQKSQSQTVNSQGGIQTIPFEFKADQYDENQHFFLSHYFRDQFRYGMSSLPVPRSNILISKIEVWVTNKQGNLNNPRNIVAFADMAEFEHIGNDDKWKPVTPPYKTPDNKANNLYSTITTDYADARDINKVNEILTGKGQLVSGLDYDKLENARLLDASEYTLNAQLGFISLNNPLGNDQVLAVAYEYTVKGNPNSFRVGEFAANISSQYQEGQENNQGKTAGALFVKLLKPVSLSPNSYTWNLMMKNVYKLGATQVQKENFKLNITYQNDSVGTYTNYLPVGKIKDQPLLRVMKLDRINSQGKSLPNGDGIFDFVEGYTILPENGRIIFPVTEPFGSHLRDMIGDSILAEKYIYQELYDLTQTAAQQIANKNKFKISGAYRASLSGSVINLNAMNVARGSVRVTSNGLALTENVDYTVDYTAGTVTIINQALIDSNADIRATLEDQSLYSMKRKTLLGLNLSYDFSKDFNIGGTIMHMYEKPITMKTGPGEESLKNTLWGMNMSYRTSSQWLTNMIDKVPWITATAPSTIAFNAEFAHLIAGHYENQYSGGYSYLDDFEAAKSRISLLDPYGWKLASTPYHDKPEPDDPDFFKNAALTNSPSYGNDRAHFAWFRIDNMFTYKKSSITPTHIKNDKTQLSDHRVRRIEISEIYPERDIAYNESASISTLNLSYYPEERGPYNLDATYINSDGKFTNPKKRWGGMMRKLDNTNFDNSNIEYIEFWLMDPFAHDKSKTNKGGYLYINLGEISEDVLKDGRKFYENGLPTDDSLNDTIKTTWGAVPKRQSTVYAFDNSLSEEARRRQDAGLNGLTTEQEFNFDKYKTFVEAIRSKLTEEALAKMETDQYSPLNDPAGDNYRHYRGEDLDNDKVSILNRYKYYNGTERNSITDNSEKQSYANAANTLPDVEDLNQDYTMNETESYFEYKIELKPERMKVGDNYIVARRDTTINLPNDSTERISWYQFKVPIKGPNKKMIGNISDFRTIRFMRMFLTDFEEEAYLRFATLDLIRGEWRTYEQPLQQDNISGNGKLNVSAVNIEENSDKEPVSYIVPPGVSRILDPNQAQLRQDNEQALSLQVDDLDPKVARAVYKNTNYDLRKYKRLQMFTHAEELINGPEIQKGEISVFLRLGSDYTNNYYEYEIPLVITPPGQYVSEADKQIVWPKENMFDFPLELLTNVKLERNREKRKANSKTSYATLYPTYDPEKPNNKVSIIGNPSLSEISVMMIGIRNNSTTQKSAEIWINELRMTDFDEEGGWAAQANLDVGLSDIGSINITGRKETAGFGAIDQNMQQRRNDDFSSYTISTNVDVGKLLPEKVKLSAPLFYSHSNQTVSPKYDPLDKDIKLRDALDVVETKAEKDSIKNLAQDKTVTKNFSLTNVKLNINSKNPMPYDPANFTFGYAFSKTEITNPTTVFDRTENYKATLNYSYSPILKAWEPFKNVQRNSGWSKYPKSLGFNYLPNNISFNSYITRFYTETKTRDLDSYTVGEDNNDKNQMLTFSQSFFWDRDFSITWDIMKNLKFSLQTGTRAEIKEPYLQVNKKLNPDGYDDWKDAVIRSIRNLGTPSSYRQTAQLTYSLPTENISPLDWITSSANYSSEYTWDHGDNIEIYEEGKNIEVGNTISNYKDLTFTNQLNMVNLYNKIPFLKKVNEKFDAKRSGRNERQTRERPQAKAKRFEIEIRLNTDSATVVSHTLGTKNIVVTAKEKGRTIKLKYKRLDENRIRINRKDTALIKLSIMDKGPSEETTLYKIAQYSARGLMSLRDVSFSYALRNETALSGFRPGVGDAFGQNKINHGLVPGLDFAFGLEGGEDFFERSLSNDWIILEEDNINPAIYNSIRKFEINAEIEPLKGLTIRLNALHEKNDRTSYQYYGKDPNNKITTAGGSFAMTTVALSSSFDSGKAKNGYNSNAFNSFIENIDVISNRIKSKYENKLSYPTTGFLQNTNYGKYDEKYGGVDKYSSDVLVPAFLSAYTGQDAKKISLSPFPILTSIMPNWNINYDGLTTLPWFKDKFRNFRLMHRYTARYLIGSYTSHLTWIEADGGDGWGFSKGLDSRENSNPTISPTSMFDISSVTLTEQFNPLFGASGTFDNNLELSLKYNYGRILNLNIPAYQLVETLQKEFVIGVGYRVNEFNRVLGLPSKNGYNNDLNVKVDLSNRTQQSLIRKLEDKYTEATSGNTTMTMKVSAEYTMSKSLSMRAFLDRIINNPLISSTGYPNANTNFGISLRFMLNQ